MEAVSGIRKQVPALLEGRSRGWRKPTQSRPLSEQPGRLDGESAIAEREAHSSLAPGVVMDSNVESECRKCIAEVEVKTRVVGANLDGVEPAASRVWTSRLASGTFGNGIVTAVRWR